MNVGQLIKALQEMPKDAEVMHLWDGEARTGIQHVWLARGGYVMTADCDEVCYSNESRPIDAPTESEDQFWRTPEEIEVANG